MKIIRNYDIEERKSRLGNGYSFGILNSKSGEEILKMPKRKDNKLSPQQERFCNLFASDQEFFGNGVQSYIEAYKPKRNGFSSLYSRVGMV